MDLTIRQLRIPSYLSLIQTITFETSTKHSTHQNTISKYPAFPTMFSIISAYAFSNKEKSLLNHPMTLKICQKTGLLKFFLFFSKLFPLLLKCPALFRHPSIFLLNVISIFIKPLVTLIKSPRLLVERQMFIGKILLTNRTLYKLLAQLVDFWL